jgi:hypothetical protein
MGIVHRRLVSAKALPFIAAAIAIGIGFAAANLLPLISAAIAPSGATRSELGIHGADSVAIAQQGLAASSP